MNFDILHYVYIVMQRKFMKSSSFQEGNMQYLSMLDKDDSVVRKDNLFLSQIVNMRLSF